MREERPRAETARTAPSGVDRIPRVVGGVRMNRRDALRQIGAVVGTGIVGGSVVALLDARRVAAPAHAASAPGPNALHIRLRAAEGEAEIVPGTRTPVWTYSAEVLSGDRSAVVPSRSYLGPTLRWRKGQRVRVTFENRLPQPSIVHWHGLNLPQRQDGQPADAIDPGQTYEYDFVVDDEPGTYWYHPHPHMNTGEQVYRGLAGMIHVLGPEPSGMPSNELSLVLQDRSFNADATLRYAFSMHDTMAGFVGDTLVTNGVAGFSATMKREPYRLRILNGANSKTQRLTLSNGRPFTVLATDGHLLPEAVVTKQLVLSPAQRVDVWIDFSTVADRSRVDLLSVDLFIQGAGLGDLDARAEVAATFLAQGPARSGPALKRLSTAPLPNTGRAVNASKPKQFVLSTRRMTHWINDDTWQERNVSELETVKAGTLELWEFVNRSPIPHPMHLHGQAFRVVKRSWDTDGLAADWKRIEPGIIETGRRDTVLVWPGQRVRLAVPFGTHKGFFLYHCHVLEHEDMGMMRSFRIV